MYKKIVQRSFSRFISSSKGHILDIKNDVARVRGLKDLTIGSLVYAGQSKIPGIALTLEQDSVIIGFLNNTQSIRKGDEVISTYGDNLKIFASKDLVGRTVNSLAIPIDNKKPIDNTKSTAMSIFSSKNDDEYGILSQCRLKSMIKTGIKHIDLFFPIGRGSRIAILGDKNTGKTTLAMNILEYQQNSSNIIEINKHQYIQQQKSDKYKLYFIYVCIGRSKQHIKRVEDELIKRNLKDQCIIIQANETETMTSQYISAITASLIANYFRNNNMHCIIVYDDLAAHGQQYNRLKKACNNILADVTSIHASILERCAQLSNQYGGGSATAICLLEVTPSLEITDSLVTFVDQCITLDRTLAIQQIWPAIKVEQIIRNTKPRYQPVFNRNLFHTVARILSESLHIQDQELFASQFGIIAEEELTNLIPLEFQNKLQYLLSQKNAMPIGHQYLSVLAACSNKLLYHVSLDQMNQYELQLHQYFNDKYPAIYDSLSKLTYYKPLDKYILKEIESIISSFEMLYINQQK